MGDGGGQGEHDTLGSESELDEAMIGGEFSSDGVAVRIGLSVEVLVAGLSGDGDHVGHPEVVQVGSDDAQGALETHFDLEPVPVEADEVEGGHREVGGHEDDSSACGMEDGDEANEEADGPP